MGSDLSIVRSHTDACHVVSDPHVVEMSTSYLIPDLYGMETREETLSSLCVFLVWLTRMLVLGPYD